MTIEECYERVQARKQRIRSITVEQAKELNSAHDIALGLSDDITELDECETALSEMILNMQ
ncbi:hypothetical protein AB9M75_08045 [Lactobacillus sp. AN1001]